ncbi:MAG: hypothetical protein K2F63_04915, partial [Muribaculaceae bacterium]|nr:hypothetical protein [Muribaculaceae bacterium]
MSKFPSFSSGIYLATLYQLAVAFIFLWLSRYIFVAYNFDSLAISGTAEALRLGLAGLRFDLSALLYFNVLFIAMRIIPWPWQTARPWLKASGWVYAICNVLMLVINIADAPYYSFTGARLRWSNILNITTDSGIGNLVGSYALMYIGIVGVCVAMILIMLGIAFIVRITPARYPIRTRVALFLLLGFLCFAGMRGRIGSGLPLAIGDAAFGVREAPQINAVLNSPFCILRSLNTRKSNYEPRLCFFSPEELAAIRTSVHVPSDTTVLT